VINDFRMKAGVGRIICPAMALGGEGVHLLAAYTPILSHPLGALSLVNQLVSSQQIRIQNLKSTTKTTKHGHTSHIFYPCTNDVSHIARSNSLGGKMNSLLTGAAHPIQARSWNFNRKTGQQCCQPADISPLLASLGHTTGDNIFDIHRVNSYSIRQATKRVCKQTIRPNLSVCSASLAKWYTNRIYDYRFIHG
jgi:hypothetical protein